MGCTKDCNENCSSSSSQSGAQGPKGKDGEKGEKGNSILCGKTDPVQSEGKAGDVYLNTVTGDFFLKNELCTWELKGNLRGPVGISGDDGPPTEPGEYCGEIYVDLTTGEIYTWNCETETWDPSDGTGFQGPQGPEGPQGPQGEAGPQGEPGEGADSSFEDWNNLALNNDFQVVTGSAAQYAKNTSGLTLVRGYISKFLTEDIGAGNGNDYLLATLPSGYRPTQRQRFAVHFEWQALSIIENFGNNDFMTVFVDTNGEIRAKKVAELGAPGTLFFDLSGIVFLSEQ